MNKNEFAYFGAGCFWHVQYEFSLIPGVIKTEVGYSGGFTDKPSYKDVCTGTTGHAEVVKVEFDSKKVSYEKLLKIFWEMHDPTQLNRQGPDIGSQYRSVIFYTNEEQKNNANKFKKELKKVFKKKVVTEISPFKEFYKAEEYHQDYYKKNKTMSCRI